MRRSCRCFAAAAQHPADRRAQLLVLSMRAPKPTTRPALSFQQFGTHSLDVLAPGFCFLRPEHPADPLIAGKRSEVFPSRQNLWARNQDASQVHRDGMDHSAGDNPGTHRSRIVAPMLTMAAWGRQAPKPRLIGGLVGNDAWRPGRSADVSACASCAFSLRQLPADLSCSQDPRQ